LPIAKMGKFPLWVMPTSNPKKKIFKIKKMPQKKKKKKKRRKKNPACKVPFDFI